MKLRKRNIWYVLLLVFVLVLQYFDVLATFENPLEDKIFQTGSRISNNIYVIGIDEETQEEYGSFNDFSRDKTADLINLLNADEKYAPAIIAIDISFYSNKNSEEDNKLVEAVKNAGNVVFVSTATFGNTVDKGNQAIFFEEPFEGLKEAALATGHSNYQFDDDGVVRHAMSSIEYNNSTVNSFAMTVYKEYCKKKGIEATLNEGFFDEFFYIVYSGEPRTYYGSVGAGCSFYKVLEGKYPSKAFKDSIVFIGAYATGMQDNYYTSIDKQNQMYGVEIHANLVNQLLNNEYKIELGSVTKLIPTILVGLLVIVLLNLLSLNSAVLLSVAAIPVYVLAVSCLANYLDILLPVVTPPLLVILLIGSGIVVELRAIRKERKEIIDKYSKFLSPAIAKKIADDKEAGIKLGGENKDIAVLFVDVRGFTTISESIEPEECVEFLSEFYQLTSSAIFNNEGMVDKFVGDETMGVFNAPTDIDNYIEKAVDAGLEIIRGYEKFNEKLKDKLKGRILYGVGVHAGKAIVGNMGSENRMEYTAIGDTVNTAARIQSKAGGLKLVVSETVYSQIKNHYICNSIGKSALKGKSEEMELFEVIEKNI